MTVQTYEADTIDITNSDGNTPDLDACCKRIMSSKLIISRLLQAVVPEYADSEPEDIIKLIGTVDVSETPVDADTVPVVKNESTEDSSIMEGKRIYDIKFTALTPQNNKIALIINLEIQNSFNAGYALIRRAEYYCARLISAQYNTVFTGSDFDKLEKVYSIWICTSPDKAHTNTISLYKMGRSTLAGEYTDTPKDVFDYDLMNVIMICLGESHTKECRGIIRMLHSLLVADIPAAEKKKIVREEYGIPMTKEFDKEVDDMCNISSLYIKRGEERGEARGIKKGIEKGIAQGIEKGIAQGSFNTNKKVVMNLYKKKLSLEDIAEAVELSVEETEKIIKENT